MRKKGAGAVGVVVLVVVILACIGVIIFWSSKSGPPPVVETNVDESHIDTYVCKAKGCGFHIDMFPSEAAKKERGPAFDGSGNEMMKCPKCGKLSLTKRVYKKK